MVLSFFFLFLYLFYYCNSIISYYMFIEKVFQDIDSCLESMKGEKGVLTNLPEWVKSQGLSVSPLQWNYVLILKQLFIFITQDLANICLGIDRFDIYIYSYRTRFWNTSHIKSQVTSVISEWNGKHHWKSRSFSSYHIFIIFLCLLYLLLSETSFQSSRLLLYSMIWWQFLKKRSSQSALM